MRLGGFDAFGDGNGGGKTQASMKVRTTSCSRISACRRSAPTHIRHKARDPRRCRRGRSRRTSRPGTAPPSSYHGEDEDGDDRTRQRGGDAAELGAGAGSADEGKYRGGLRQADGPDVGQPPRLPCARAMPSEHQVRR